MTRLRVASHNIHSAGRSAGSMERGVRRLARAAKRPEVIALQEATRFVGSIPGYVRHSAEAPFGHEARNGVVLVRADVRIAKRGLIRVDGPDWVGPVHGKMHPARTFPWVTVVADGLAWRVVDVHRTPGGPDAHIEDNRDSWAAEDRELTAHADRQRSRHPGRPVVFVGDQNDRASTRAPLNISAFAERVYGRLCMDGIDGAVLVNCRGRIRKLRRRYGSDHHPVVLTLTANTKE